MNETVVINAYIVISIIIAATDILLAVKSFKKNKTTGRFLGFACMGAAIVDISYLISIISGSYMCMAAMSSIYFISIDFMLVSLLIFTVYFTKGKFSGYGKWMVAFCFLYCIYELIVFAVNPFMEIAIEYKPRDTLIAKYSYQMKPLYELHLIFSYVMVLLVVGLLIRKICKIPHEYRWQYLSVIIGILIIVGINAIFLFLPGESVVNLLDYSIGGYSIVSFIIYWSCFDYSTHGMLNKLKTSIFENIGQGIVLFDDDEHLILHNERADFFLGEKLLTGCKDINSLSVINSTLGKKAGDQKIRLLSENMRTCFPERAYYVRGTEAHLIALCSRSSEDEMAVCAGKLKEKFDGSIQYAVSVVEDETHSIVESIRNTTKAMRTKKLVDSKSIHSDMLASLIRALEECDSDTEHHVRRTQIMGAELGKRIELSDIQQSRLSLLCLLHDIGKIGVPMEILNKPGKLTDEEWKIMRSHVEKGYDIANSNVELKQIAEEIRHHHERWDGKGYPDGLSRESIPVLSRVIAVVDAFDAMVSDRPYRNGMPVSDALEELKKCAGTQFDPFIVSEFIQMISENYSDTVKGVHKFRQEKKKPQHKQVAKPEDNSTLQEAFCVHTVQCSRYLLDGSWNILSVDDNFEKLTGYSGEDVEKNSMNQMDLIPEADRTEYLCRTNANLAKSTYVLQEHRLHRKDGKDIYVFCYGRVFYDSAVKQDRAEIIISDVSSTYSMKILTDAEQNKAEVRLRNWENTYRTDSLTGLLNHAAFRNDMEMKLLSGDFNAMMIMIDVDKFKQYNDTYGHHNGDKYLILVAQTLLVSLRNEDFASRMGGDEFAVMMFFNKSVPEKAIKEHAQQIFDKVNLTVKSAEGGTGISMGAVIAKSEATFNRLYEEADNALYEAKESGRGRLVVKEHGEK